ncbi:hypothetical protein ACLB2K_032642 [Fragaria x ananassa]
MVFSYFFLNCAYDVLVLFWNNCGICLSSMATPKGQAIFTVQCSHSFHYPCIVLSRMFSMEIFVSPFAEQYGISKMFLSNQTTGLVLFPLNITTQQHQAFPEPTSFDDEPLLSTSPMQSNDPQGVTIKTQTESLAISAAESNPRYPVLVSICAPSLQDIDGHVHTPIDVVTVLDVSSSMCGLKLDLVKRAVKFIIQNLGPSDRLSIVTFSTTARRVFPLRMSVEGREIAVRAVNSLGPDNMTNIVAGLEIGTLVLEERRERNPVASIMLLSDGMDTYCHSSSQLLAQLPASIHSNCMQHEIPVHTFGFGSDHDPNTMHPIFLYLMHQEVRLTVRSASHGVKIVAIPSGRYVKTISDEDLQGVVDVGSLYAEEEKQFLVYLFVPQSSTSDTKTSLLDVSCVYRDIASNELIQVQGDLVEILRPERATTRGDTINSCLSASFGAAQASHSARGTFQQQQLCVSAGATPFGGPAPLLRAGGAYETSSMVRMVQKSKDLGTSYTK